LSPLRASQVENHKAAAIWNGILWRILLQKSFWGAERKFLEPLMRLAPRDVRDLIVSEKNDHGPSYWRYGALQRWSCLKYYFREILGVVRFSTFATKSARSGHSPLRQPSAQ
jgi:hypothetical protein